LAVTLKVKAMGIYTVNQRKVGTDLRVAVRVGGPEANIIHNRKENIKLCKHDLRPQAK